MVLLKAVHEREFLLRLFGNPVPWVLLHQVALMSQEPATQVLIPVEYLNAEMAGLALEERNKNRNHPTIRLGRVQDKEEAEEKEGRREAES